MPSSQQGFDQYQLALIPMMVAVASLFAAKLIAGRQMRGATAARRAQTQPLGGTGAAGSLRRTALAAEGLCCCPQYGQLHRPPLRSCGRCCCHDLRSLARTALPLLVARPMGAGVALHAAFCQDWALHRCRRLPSAAMRPRPGTCAGRTPCLHLPDALERKQLMTCCTVHAFRTQRSCCTMQLDLL